MARNIGATLSLKDNNFFATVKSATSATGSLKSALTGATSTLKSHGAQASSTGASLKSLAKSALGLVAAYMSFNTIKDFLTDCISAANEQAAAEKRLQTTMSNVTGTTQAQIDAIKQYAAELQKTTTVGDEAAITGASQLATFQLQGDTIKTLMPALEDLAVAQYGVSVSGDQMQSMANLMGKVMSGNVSALSRYGVVMNDTQKKILQTGTESEKAAMLVEVLGQNFGGLAEAMANTPEGRIQQLKNAWGDMQEVIGTKLYPILTQFLTYVTSKLPAIQGAIETVVNAVMPIVQGLFSQVTSYIEAMLPIVRDVFEGYIIPVASRVVGAIQTAFSVLTPIVKTVFSGYIMPIVRDVGSLVISVFDSVQGAIEKNKNNFSKIGDLISSIGNLFMQVWLTIKPALSWVIDNIIPAIVTAIGFLIPVITTAIDVVAGAVSVVRTVLTAIFNAVSAVLSPIINAFSAAWELIKTVWGYVAPYFQMVWNSIAAVFGVVKAVIGGAFTVAWTVIKAVWDTVIGYFQAIWNTIAGIFGVVKSVLTGDWQGAWDGIRGMVDTWAGYFSGIWESIKSIFGSVGAWFGGVFTAAVTAIKTAFSTVVGFFQGIWNSISSMFTKIGTTIANGISGAFKSVINAVINFAGGLINGFIRSINWAIDVINKIPGVSISKLQEVSLPQLALGGTAISSGAALVGENGPEIIDMPKGASVIPLDKARRDGDTYENTTKNYYITLNINAVNKTTDEIVNELVPKLKLALSNI